LYKPASLSIAIVALSVAMLPSMSALSAQAGENAATAPASELAEYTKRGADSCIKCHDEDSSFPVFAIFKSKHGSNKDSRTPMATLQCETCHGPGLSGKRFPQQSMSGGHAQKIRPGHRREPILNFGRAANESVSVQNAMCLQCHQDERHINWWGSQHEMNQVACVACHQIHIERDPMRDAQLQAEVCFRCHQKQRLGFAQSSSHPLRQGLIRCSDCHDSHGSAAPFALIRSNINDTCFQCHAEKRGPFLWEHAPVAENCDICHSVHGSMHPAMLKKRLPWLCQQCHSQFGHPSVSYTEAGLRGGNRSGFLLAGSCVNCHSQVHGSNHPSGVNLMR